MSIDDEVEEAIGSPFGWYTDEIRELFETGNGLKIARIVCELCGNREIGSIRWLTCRDVPLMIAGHYEDVAIRGTVVRRVLMAHDVPDDPRNGHRRAPRPLIVEPVVGAVGAWCPKHKRFLVPEELVRPAIRRYEELAAAGPVREPPTIRVDATHRRSGASD